MEKNNLIENAYMALLDRGIKATESDYVKRGLKTSEQRKAFDNRVKMVGLLDLFRVHFLE